MTFLSATCKCMSHFSLRDQIFAANHSVRNTFRIARRENFHPQTRSER